MDPQLTLGDLSKNISPLAGFSPAVPKPDGFWSSNPIFSFINNVSTTISNHRSSLDLVNPGTMENINKEVTRDVFLNQYAFTGLRAELNKMFSVSPVFQTSHSFSIGGQTPPYSFVSMVANDKVFMQGSVDNDLSLSGRFHYNWDKHILSKTTVQFSKDQPSMVQMELDYLGNDFSLNLKSLNPNFIGSEFQGVLVGSILQSITSKLSLGLETVYSSMQPGMPGDAAISFYSRYDAKDWIASAQLQGSGALIGSFWRKVSDKVEAGLETSIQAGVQPVLNEMMQPVYQTVIDATTTIGAKYEFRQSIYRGQIDSNGKIGCFLEHRVLPTAGLLVSAELDQAKNTAKIGLGLQLEFAGSEEIMMMQNGLIDANGNPVPGAQQM